ncbi:MAG: YdeI/OmpD-associated family protein [Tetrasphaera sp.]
MNARIGQPGGTRERPALFFSGPEEFRAWLAANHDSASELWMGLRKKHVADRGLMWAEAVPEALCFGWIDSVSQRIDADTSRQRWTPRRRGSVWSEVNIAHAERLIAAGRMQPAGLAAYEARTPEKSGIYAYEQGQGVLPPEYAARLASEAVAAQWFELAPASYRRLAVHWVLSAKQSTTRDRRIDQLIADSAQGQLIKPQRYGEEPGWVAKNRSRLGLGDPE